MLYHSLLVLVLFSSASALAARDAGNALISFNGSPPSSRLDVQAGSVGTWTITYTAGVEGVAIGGGIEFRRIPAKFWLGQCLQSTNPRALDYVTYHRTGEGSLALPVLAEFYKETFFARVTVKDKPLAPGEQIIVNFGDRIGGGPGAVVPPSTQYGMEFYVCEDTQGDGVFTKLSESMFLNCVPGPPHRIVLTVPSLMRAGESGRLHVRIEDANSNICTGFTGTIRLKCTDPKAQMPTSVSFSTSDKGCKEAVIRLLTPGDTFVSATAAGAKGTSNPCRVTKATPARRIFWGDLHNHTEESDGTGTVDQTYLYARDAIALDFCTVSDHLMPTETGPDIDDQSPHGKLGIDAWWKHQQDQVKRYHSDGKFVALLGYEWTLGTEDGGDHNTYFADPDAALVCLTDLNEQYRVLRSLPSDAIVIPHVGGRAANWKFHDPKVEPALEIASMHGHFEWFAQEALSKGYRMGFTGGSDGHLGLPGNDVWPLHGRSGMTRRDYGVPSAITAVYATDLTRAGILQAIKERRTYATTGVRILLDFTMDGNTMGSEYSSNKAPRLSISVTGTAPLQRIEVIRNDKRVFDKKLSDRAASIEFVDKCPLSGTAYYYVRVTQSDGELAWSSPIWLTYTGKTIPDSRKLAQWNAEDEPPVRSAADRNYTADLLKHLAWRAPGRYYGLKQAGIVHNDRGSYAVFHGRDRKSRNGLVHIRWYIGFPDERVRVDPGWRDFGTARG